jgi:hypothetical protein
MPEGWSARVLEFSIFLEEHTDLEDDFIQFFFFGIVMRSIGLYCLVVFVDGVKLLNLF